MGFIEDLKNGLPGIHFAIPATFQVHEERERRTVMVDNERRVGWHVIHAPWRLDLRPVHDQALRQDVERGARQSFQDQYVQLAAEAPKDRVPSRTADPEWSPVVDVQYVQVGGAPALFILRRLAYEPGLEVVLGSLLIPLSTGICEITAFQRSSDAGQRESMLLTLAMQQNPGEEAPKLARKLGQPYFDDPKHDAQFPTHPLTCVRAALRWVMEGGADLIKVTAPMPVMEPGEVEFPAAECAIVPPPRYLPLPPGTVPVPRTMAVLTRVPLEAGESPIMLDVWLVNDVTIPGDALDRQQQLLDLAKRNAWEWEKQGAKEVDVHIRALPPQGDEVRVAAEILMRIGEAKSQSVARWLAAPDGRVYRMTVGAPSHVPMEDLSRDVDAALASFRQIKTATVSGAWLTSDLRLRPKAAPAEAPKNA